MYFFADSIFAVLASSLLIPPPVVLIRIICCVASIVSMSLPVYGREQRSTDRLKAWNEIKDANLGEYLPEPKIELPLMTMSLEDTPRDLRNEKEFGEVQKLFDLAEKHDYSKAYIQADKFLQKYEHSPLTEWVLILKADFLFHVQEARQDKKYGLVLEEYQDALRRYPLNPQNARILYQICLLQLDMGFYADVEVTAARGLKEFDKSIYLPYYRLLNAEGAYKARDDIRANFEFTMLIQKFPQHRVAIDAAFRKAFIQFRKADFKAALKVYEDLEKFHSDEIESLKMKVEPADTDKFTDRAYYAETLYLNKKYNEAAKLFQDLANLFPAHTMSPHLYLRLADTYYWRGQNEAAEELYKFVLNKYSSNKEAQAAARIRLADFSFLTGSLEGIEKPERYYEKAYRLAKEAEVQALAALALVRLASFHFYNKAYPRAQAVLRTYRKEFEKTSNQEWVETYYTATVEIEILDYCNREDYLAALSTYLGFEGEQASRFTNTHVLLRLADAASRLSLHERASQILNRVIYLEKTSEGRQEALLKLIDILIINGDFRKASERLRRFNFAYPQTNLNHLYEMAWGQLYLGLKNNEQAALHFEKALQYAKNSPDKKFELRYVLTRLAEVYERLALPLKAIDAYEDYIRLIKEANNPLKPKVVTSKDIFLQKVSRYRIADIYYGMRDHVKALEAYRLVVNEVKDEPFWSHAQYRIGECFLALNDRAAALKAFENLQSSDPQNIWVRAAKTYIASVQMEVKYGIRIFN